MAPASYMVMGSRAAVGGTRETRMVPPVVVPPVELAVGDVLDVLVPPQAASRRPMVVAERPTTEARTSNCRRVILPFWTSSTRCCAYSDTCWLSAIGTP
jgi:hypothetical protein